MNNKKKNAKRLMNNNKNQLNSNKNKLRVCLDIVYC